jgi:hypothetical protein
MPDLIINDTVLFTEDGGIAIKMVNKTGSPSVKGELVESDSTVDRGFNLCEGDDVNCIGVVYEAGVVDGSDCWVVIYGVAQVLLKDATAATSSYWAATSDTAGRADCTNANAPGVILTHFQEIGHCIETKIAGTDVLARVVLHFN